MRKHADPITYGAVAYRKPKHSAGWRPLTGSLRDLAFARMPYTPGKHAKPFAKHHPAAPVTYDATGHTTPLTPPALVLDAAA